MSKSLYIRWLGAFRRHGQTFHQAMEWELSPEHRDEVACEWIPRNYGSHLGHVKVGLLISNKAVTRRFDYDCYSVRNKETKHLFPTRNKAWSEHREAFALPMYTGIVMRKIPRKKVLNTIRYFSELYSLPVYVLGKSGNIEDLRQVDIVNLPQENKGGCNEN